MEVIPIALGFHITVYRADKETVVARWDNMWARHHCDGLAQFERAVKRGEGQQIGKNGYPLSYEIKASAVLPLEVHGTCHQVTNTRDIPRDEVLYIEAWDQS